MSYPIPSDELAAEIREGEAAMTPDERRLWSEVKIPPEKWQLHPWGDGGGGFWVVGIVGWQVVWYNDIEGGFDISPYTEYGAIGEYLCSQLELSHVVHIIADKLQTRSPDQI